jgi:hypothetical protein
LRYAGTVTPPTKRSQEPEIWARDGDAVLIDMIERFRTHVV